tara:strand:- start:1867 stop:2133 length:267 start_codon:yes stop_codon:yes gene_type:complete
LPIDHDLGDDFATPPFADAPGPGAVAGEGLRARQASVANDGPGSVTLTVEVTAKVVSTGSGDVTIGGKPACTVDNGGTGRIQCGDESY